MTPAERVHAVTALGFSERQARFLVLAMLHAGVCLGRQYCTFSGIKRGQKTHDFLGLLLARGFATAYPRAHGSTHLYHLHGKTLYRAIDEVNNRNRRPMALPRAIERLMLLDAVIARPDIVWLATEREKVTHFAGVTRLRPHELPHLRFGRGAQTTVRYFPDKLPIGIVAERGPHHFLYLITRQLPIDFRAFLHRHAELLRALPAWTIRLLSPRHLAGAIPRFQAALRDELATPLQPATRDELSWYFERRKTGRASGTSMDTRFEAAREAFRTPRFRVLYRTWLQYGDDALHATLSPALADALTRRAGQVDCEVLPHEYQHLGPLVGTA
jgi:hypothetical protein